MKKDFPLIRLSLLALFAAAGPVAAEPLGITLILPPVGTGTTLAEDMNAQGDIVGNYTDPQGRPRAFVYRGGVSTALPEPAGTTGSGANAINASGVIVGFCRDVDLRACTWTGDVVTILPVPNGASDTIAHAINDAGLIVGSYTDASSDTHICLWQSGNLVYPSEPMGTTESSGVSVGNNGRFLGNAWSAGGMRALRWMNAATVATLPLPPGATESQAAAINDVGLAVGSAFTSMDVSLACVWQADLVDVLPSPGNGGSSAVDLNTGGQIIGDFYPEGEMTVWAWSWITGTPELLPRPAGAVSSSAVAINDARQIAVNFSLGNGTTRAALLGKAFQPTIRIAGRKKVVTSKSRIVIRGTTTDFVDRVAWQGGGKAGSAKGTRQWSFTCRPKTGRQVIRAKATGPGGTSTPARVTVVRR